MKKHQIFLPLSASLLASSVLAAGVPVTAISVSEGVYQPSIELVAKMEAKEHANLTARVSGYLTKQYFPDGAYVNEGDVLFQIDETPYKLALQAALANKQQAEAVKQQAELDYQRTHELVRSGSATQANLDDANAALSVAKAGFAMAEASVDKASNDLWHTKIRAPYDGQLGKSQFSMGDMVSPIAGSLIDIAQLHPLNALFSLGHDDYQQFPIDQAGAVNVSLQNLSNEGTVTFVDNKLNASTGTLQASASFSNEDNLLRPNQVTKVLLTSQSHKVGHWVPQTAVVQDLMMQFVYVVNEEGLAERREIKVAAREGNQVFIESGLKSEEQVITDGLVRVRPNVPVLVQ